MYTLIISYLLLASQSHADPSVAEIACKVIDKNFEVSAGTMQEILSAKTRSQALQVVAKAGLPVAVFDQAIEETRNATFMELVGNAISGETHIIEKTARRNFSTLGPVEKDQFARFLVATEKKDDLKKVVAGQTDFKVEPLTHKIVKGEKLTVYGAPLEGGKYIKFVVKDGRPIILTINEKDKPLSDKG